MERDGFIFYRSFYEASKFLSNEDKGRLFDMVCQYWLNWKEIDWDWPAMWMFLLIKPQLDANNRRYENWCKWWQYGTLWWRPPKTWDNSQKPLTNPKLTPSEPLTNPKLTPKDKDKDKDKENEKEKEGGTLGASSAEAPRIQQIMCDVVSGLEESDEKRDVGFNDIYNSFYHKSWHKRDYNKSLKEFNKYGFTQQELKDILYDELIFKYEYKYKIKDVLSWPKFDTYISGFNRNWDNQRDERLRAIAKYHMTNKDDINKMQERSKELKAAFWEQRFKQIAHDVSKELNTLKIVAK